MKARTLATTTKGHGMTARASRLHGGSGCPFISSPPPPPALSPTGHACCVEQTSHGLLPTLCTLKNVWYSPSPRQNAVLWDFSPHKRRRFFCSWTLSLLLVLCYFLTLGEQHFFSLNCTTNRTDKQARSDKPKALPQ